ncbi:MAG: prenyltransferase [Chitinophagaceae bacterium BSSC1]|nr:MAG: prenyltransferase [Chitinophagaceae bacterium BSSC1]
MLLKKSTLQLLRFPFSFFLMPVFWFALSFTQQINWLHAIAAFLLLHVLLYPASNGYNSYMDRDTESIGGIEKPMEPSYELYLTSLSMDLLALIFAFIVSIKLGFGFLCYILFSRLYSWRKIRLKQYPIIGYLTVILNQGALVFYMVFDVCSKAPSPTVPLDLLIAASLLIGGFYPITQIYQHKQDQEDGVKTISILLGKNGTFLFCMTLYVLAFGILFWHFNQQSALKYFYLLQLFFLPVVTYFLYWFYKVWKNPAEAGFKQTMFMNWLASSCTNAAFITLLIFNYFG